jgi:DNA-binding MarR family transcriptional regulator
MVANSGAASRKHMELDGPELAARERLASVRGMLASSESRELDSLIHHRMRLGIVSALAADDSLSFNDLKAVLETTDGNLSVHARRLEDANYIAVSKRFEGRRPRTEYSLTPLGRKALQKYLDHMDALIQATRGTLER